MSDIFSGFGEGTLRRQCKTSSIPAWKASRSNTVQISSTIKHNGMEIAVAQRAIALQYKLSGLVIIHSRH
jgi:hypothetical protein